MKKLISILTAVTMLMLLVCAATADESRTVYILEAPSMHIITTVPLQE